MIAGQIKKWQDNISDDVASHKEIGKENLVNAILEVACQLAGLREDLRNKSLATNIFNDINIPSGPPKWIPKKYFNDKGEIDLSKVTGEEAREYFIKFLGISFPVGVSRKG